ncbi:MAG: hypothetical protein V3S33_00025, partial [Gammaproteobacteria bacterium]
GTKAAPIAAKITDTLNGMVKNQGQLLEDDSKLAEQSSSRWLLCLLFPWRSSSFSQSVHIIQQRLSDEQGSFQIGLRREYRMIIQKLTDPQQFDHFEGRYYGQSSNSRDWLCGFKGCIYIRHCREQSGTRSQATRASNDRISC